MRFFFRVLVAVAAIASTTSGSSVFVQDAAAGGPNDELKREHTLHNDDPIVIGHRGASGLRPEHTLESYWLAIQEGADFIEPDLVSTRDGQLVARHENEIGGTTDVAMHSEFSGRFTTKTIDGVPVPGWFTEDFTLAELKTLRARERLPMLRSTSFDGLFEIPTLQEVIDLVRRANELRREQNPKLKPIGIYPETKHPTYFDGIGLSLEEPLVSILHANGYRGRKAQAFIQSFEAGNLRDLAEMTEVPLAQLINLGGKPYDFVVSGNPKTYADMVKPAGLVEISKYARGVGVNKDLIVPRNSAGALLPATTLVRDAHKAGLVVHGWTFRAENTFLPADFRIGLDPRRVGDLRAELNLFMELGIDGYFTDFPGIGAAERNAFVERR